MGKSKRSVEKSAVPAKKKRTLPPLHESQEALAQRAAKIGEDEAIAIVAPPGYGKTRAAARYIQLRHAEDGSVSLTFFVASTAYMAHKQSHEIGSDFDYSYQYFKQHRQITQMLLDSKSVLTTMTPAMFNKAFLGDKYGRAEGGDPLQYFQSTILQMTQGTPCTTIRFVLDEMHTFFGHGFPDAIKAMRKAIKPAALIITGLTATLPESDEIAPALKAMTRCTKPTLVEYTPEELAAFDADLRPQPKVGDAFKIVKLADPSAADRYADEMDAMATLIVGAMLSGETTVKTRTCLEHATSKVVAKQAHAGGGVAFAHVQQEPMRKTNKNGELTGKYAPHHEALVIAHATLCGASTAWVELSSLQGQEDVREFAVHDLRSVDITDLDQAIAAFKQSFLDQVEPALAIVNPQMRHSTNAFDKNTSGVIAVGKWEAKGLKQLAGRLARPCKLEAAKDIVPKEFKLVHLDSDWQRAVLKIRATKVAASGVTLSPEVQTMLKKLNASGLSPEVHAMLKQLGDPDARVKDNMHTIEANLYKLAAADEKKTLGATTMAADYLEALLDMSKGQAMLDKYKAARTELLTYKDAEGELEAP